MNRAITGLQEKLKTDLISIVIKSRRRITNPEKNGNNAKGGDVITLFLTNLGTDFKIKGASNNSKLWSWIIQDNEYDWQMIEKKHYAEDANEITQNSQKM